MANPVAILDKIDRNLKQRGLTSARVGETVELTKTGGDILTVSYVTKNLDSPMGGVSDAASPFLGIGVGAPGSIKIKGEATETTIALIMDTSEALELLHECSGFSNDIIIEDGDTTTELARIRGHESTLGTGS